MECRPTFVKFHHIDNMDGVCYSERFRSGVKMVDESISHGRPRWVVLEKIDGSNISIVITRNEYKIAKRSSFVCSDNELHNVGDVVRTKLGSLIKCIQDTIGDNEQITLYGELFGTGIQNRIYYGPDLYVRFFGGGMIYFDWDGKFNDWSFEALYNYLNKIVSDHSELNLSVEDLVVPILAKTDTFDEAAKYPNDGISKLTDNEHNSIMEGVVIRPYSFTGHEVIFPTRMVVKNKNDKFKEVKKNHNNTTYSSEVNNLRSEFCNYLTINRMYTVFSKLGHPKSLKDVSVYLSEFASDAAADFIKDHPEISNLDEKEQKVITKGTSSGFAMFREVAVNLGLSDLFISND